MASKKVANIKITDNSKEIRQAMSESADKILEAIGQQAAKHAREYLNKSGAVDTALLRNSVTFAVSGESANISTYKADRIRKGETKVRKGEYKGSAPNDNENRKAVYIGTNVEYANAIENGTSGMNPRPYIKPAVQDHKDEYKEIALQYMKQG